MQRNNGYTRQMGVMAGSIRAKPAHHMPLPAINWFVSNESEANCFRPHDMNSWKRMCIDNDKALPKLV